MNTLCVSFDPQSMFSPLWRKMLSFYYQQTRVTARWLTMKPNLDRRLLSTFTNVTLLPAHNFCSSKTVLKSKIKLFSQNTSQVFANYSVKDVLVTALYHDSFASLNQYMNCFSTGWQYFFNGSVWVQSRIEATIWCSSIQPKIVDFDSGSVQVKL